MHSRYVSLLASLSLCALAACSGSSGGGDSGGSGNGADPVAVFTATMDALGVASVDATASTDAETAAGALEVCWDWDDDGACDSAWSTARVAAHSYAGAPGLHTIRLKVRDGDANVAETTQDVTAPTIQYVSGSIATTIWSDTIVATGDVTVPAGNTLTLSAGTTVFFMSDDLDVNDVGDYGLAVNGVLSVSGTAGSPVRIARHPDAPVRAGGSWAGLWIGGATSSTVSHLVLEDADQGITVSNGTALSDVVVRGCAREGVVLSGAGSALTRVTAEGNGTAGVRANAAGAGATIAHLVARDNAGAGLEATPASSTTVADSTLDGNGGDGVRTTGARTTLDHVALTANARAGISIRGDGTVTVTNAEISANSDAGVLTERSRTPAVLVQYSNVHGNGVAGTTVSDLVDPSTVLSVSAPQIGVVASPTWTAPAGSTIDRVQLYYSEWTTAQPITGLVGTSTVMWPALAFMMNGGTSWLDLPDPTPAIRVGYNDSGPSSGQKTVIALSALVRGPDAAQHLDLSAANDAGSVNAKFNFWTASLGEVSSKVYSTYGGVVDFTGYVGTAYAGAGPRP